ncbi:hypothetical protein EV401DRAFT_608027 [Pisolithus croceorrhizus]|nr:hypothetical protein EV401DRAFT_608027 [Pisolithus croceorrhizus]
MTKLIGYLQVLRFAVYYLFCYSAGFKYSQYGATVIPLPLRKLLPTDGPRQKSINKMTVGTYVCPFGDGCTLPLESTTASIYAHLRLHGHVYSHRSHAPCPWPGCSKEIRWGNVARHIIECHLRVKLQCVCGRTYARKGALVAHMNICETHIINIIQEYLDMTHYEEEFVITN